MTGNLNDSISSIYKSKEANNDSIYQQQQKGINNSIFKKSKGLLSIQLIKEQKSHI